MWLLKWINSRGLITKVLTIGRSYLVTDLLGTDLNRLLTSKPLDGKFVQYFTYQLLVRLQKHSSRQKLANDPSEASNTSTPQA